MTLKRKLSLGLGFLFFLIFALGIFYSLQIGRLTQDAENIVKDNYNSLVYAKNMATALEDTRTAVSSIVFNAGSGGQAPDYFLKLYQAGRVAFEDNLKSEKGNITEIQEKDDVESVVRDFALYVTICTRIVQAQGTGPVYFNEYQPAFEKLRQTIGRISDLNMQAVERKNQMAKRDAERIIRVSAGIGVFCVLLALAYFWYFPFYVSSSIAYLADRMKALLEKAGLVLDTKTNDESFILLQGINLLENRFEAEGRREPAAE